MKTASRLLTVFLALLMIVYAIPLGVFAEEVRDRTSESGTQAGEVSTSDTSDTASPLPLFSSETEAEIKGKLYLGTFEIESLRDAYTKHIRLDDGSYVAVQYSEAVHKLGSDGKWSEIDNTLVSPSEGDTSGYVTGDSRISFAGSLGGRTLYRISENGYTVEMSIVNGGDTAKTDVLSASAPHAVNAERRSIASLPEKEAKLFEITDMAHLHSSIAYSDAFPGADLEYVLDGLGIKENIIVKSPAASYTYKFALRLSGLAAVVCDDGSIELRDSTSGEVKYCIPLPYMYDASGARSDAVSYSLDSVGKNVWTLTVTASSEWINSPDRAFPVTVDPPIYSTAAAAVTDTYIDSTAPNASHSTGATLVVSQDQSALWRSTESISIPSSAYIDSAELIASIYNKHSASLYVKAHRITSTWSASVTYNTAPSYDATVLDFNYITSTSGETYGRFNITEAFRDWHYGDASNYGVMLRGESSGSVSFYSNDHATRTARPTLYVHYVDMRGVEGWYPTLSHSAGAAGTGTVNTANGSLSVINPIMSAPNFVLPYTVSLAYDSALAGKAYVNSVGDINVPYSYASAGRGWKLSMSETIVPASYTPGQGTTSVTYYIWTDSDGTEHAFMPTSNGKYRDEDGLGLTLAKQIDGSFTITDRSYGRRTFAPVEDGNYFSGDGAILAQIADKNGNRIDFTRDTYGRVTAISFTPGTGTTPSTQLNIAYHTVSGGVGPIKYVVNTASGEGAIFRYSSTATGSVSGTATAYLREIYHVRETDGVYTESNWSSFVSSGSNSGLVISSKVCYTYNSSGRLTYAEDVTSQYKIGYGYDSAGKLTDIMEYAAGASGQQLSISYSDTYTVVRGSGTDDLFGNSDDVRTYYSFDRSGRAISAYSTDMSGTALYGATAGIYSDSEGSENKLTSHTVTGGSFENLVTNGGFEKTQVFYAVPGYTVSSNASLSTADPLDGRRCLALAPTSAAASSATQNIYLPAGDYTLSAYVKAENNSGTAVTLSVSYGGTALATESAPVSVGSESAGYVYTSVSFTVTVARTYTVKLEASTTSTAARSVYVDNVMLTQGVCTAEYNLIEYGGFESASSGSNLHSHWSATTPDGPNYDPVVGASGNPLFGNALVIDGSITGANFVDQTVYTATAAEIAAYTSGSSLAAEAYTVSAWAKGTAQVTNNGASSFAILVEITYYDGSDYETVQHWLSFNKSYTDWQFLSTGFSTDPSKGMITKIVLSCTYNFQPGTAYFDKISLVRNSETTTLYDYDANGNVITERRGKDWTEKYYDIFNHLTEAYTSDGTYAFYTYDAQENCTYVAEGFFSGDIVDRVPPSIDDIDYFRYTRYIYTTGNYDHDGLLLEEKVYYETEDGESVEDPITTRYTYETVNRLIFGAPLTTTDTYGGVSRSFYDSTNGRLLATISPDGNGICYTYNSKGALETVKPAVYVSSSNSYSALSNEEAVTYTYDSHNRLSLLETETQSYSFDYDVFGNVVLISDGSVDYAEYNYNYNNGKLVRVYYANGGSVSYTYDEWGRVATKSDNSGYYSYEYDTNGRLYRVQGSVVENYDGYDRSIEYIYKYNSDDSLNKVVYILNGELQYSANYTYDSKDRLHKYEYSFYDDGFDQGLLYNYSYDDRDRLSCISIYESGVYVDQFISYDDHSRLVSRENRIETDDGINGVTYAYTYTTAMVDYTTQTGSRIATMSVDGTTYSYTYDANGNITQIKQGNTVYNKYTYDNLGQLLREDNRELGYSYVYTYDNSGNMTSYKVYAFSLGTLGKELESRSFVYCGDRMENGAEDEIDDYFTYDSLGNLEIAPSYYNLPTMLWNGRLLTSAGLSYNYNDEGIRIEKVNSVVYDLAGTQILSERCPDGTWSRVYIYDENGSPIGFKYHGSNHASGAYDYYYYVKNLQGDVTKLYGADGTLYATYKYDAWGNHTVTYSNGGASIAAVSTNPIRYRSYYYDTESNLYYLNSRYYSPILRRFISPDSIDVIGASPMTLTDKNLYAYCDNNPVMRSDNGGAFWDTVFDVVSLGFSIYDVFRNPDDPMAWIGLAADIVSLAIPFATGGGLIVDAVTKADDVVDLAKTADRTIDALDTMGDVGKASQNIAEIATKGTPNQIGQIGEQLAGISSKGKTKIFINGRYRIPDKLTDDVLTEVKNVKYISNTQQLKDFADFAHQAGRQLELYVRPTTKVAQTVIDAGWNIRYLW